MISVASFPQRIVCLTEETTETLYLLGAGDRVAGVSGYTARPPEARQKPKVSAFTTAKIERIAELQPDLILTFSDLQADLARELIARGFTVVAFNQRSIEQTLQMILTLGRIADRAAQATTLVEELRSGLRAIECSAQRFSFRAKVFFEEWKDPLISGIRWVEELIEIAGGQPVFPELRFSPMAKDRVVSPQQVALRDPDVVIASWCGTKVNKDTIRRRVGWDQVTAVIENRIFEVKSTYLLAPGPAALTEGVRQIHAILCQVAGVPISDDLRPAERCDPAVHLFQECV